MRVFNEGVHTWHNIIEPDINELLYELFRIFFFLDGLVSIPSDDKRFNFCFISIEENMRKAVKQGIVKTLIYLAKEFPG